MSSSSKACSWWKTYPFVIRIQSSSRRLLHPKSLCLASEASESDSFTVVSSPSVGRLERDVEGMKLSIPATESGLQEAAAAHNLEDKMLLENMDVTFRVTRSTLVYLLYDLTSLDHVFGMARKQLGSLPNPSKSSSPHGPFTRGRSLVQPFAELLAGVRRTILSRQLPTCIG